MGKICLTSNTVSNRARIQRIKPSILRMKTALSALRLNELLGLSN